MTAKFFVGLETRHKLNLTKFHSTFPQGIGFPNKIVLIFSQKAHLYLINHPIKLFRFNQNYPRSTVDR